MRRSGRSPKTPGGDASDSEGIASKTPVSNARTRVRNRKSKSKKWNVVRGNEPRRKKYSGRTLEDEQSLRQKQKAPKHTVQTPTSQKIKIFRNKQPQSERYETIQNKSGLN